MCGAYVCVEPGQVARAVHGTRRAYPHVGGVGGGLHPTYPTLAILGAAFVLVKAIRLKIARVG